MTLRSRAAWIGITGAFAASIAMADITNITQGTTHPTIQDAIDQAHDHDEIVVDPGYYSEPTIVLRGKPFTLRSQDPLDPDIVVRTVLNGSGVSVFHGNEGEGPDTIISGFVLTAHSTDLGAICLHGSNPTIRRCSFQWCFGAAGGGIFLWDSSAAIVDCSFAHNQSFEGGGGIRAYASTATIRNCFFHGNTASTEGGGGLYLSESTAVIDHCRFTRGTANLGGAIHADTSEVTITDCSFTGHAFQDTGGGVYLDSGSIATIEDCHFADATGMSGTGGGLAVLNGSDATVLRSTFEGHSAAMAGGIFVGLTSTATITGCRIEHNYADYVGGGISVMSDGSSVTLQDTVVCGNNPDQIDGPYNDAGGNALHDYVPPPAPMSDVCPEDINGDGVVDLSDLGALLAVFSQPCP